MAFPYNYNGNITLQSPNNTCILQPCNFDAAALNLGYQRTRNSVSNAQLQLDYTLNGTPIYKGSRFEYKLQFTMELILSPTVYVALNSVISEVEHNIQKRTGVNEIIIVDDRLAFIEYNTIRQQRTNGQALPTNAFYTSFAAIVVRRSEDWFAESLIKMSLDLQETSILT